MRWIAVLVLAVIGCGGEVTNEGETDQYGCLMNREDVSGTATRGQPGVSVPGCPGLPDSIQIVDGEYMGQFPALFSHPHDETSCLYIFSIKFSDTCEMSYTIH